MHIKINGDCHKVGYSQKPQNYRVAAPATTSLTPSALFKLLAGSQATGEWAFATEQTMQFLASSLTFIKVGFLNRFF